jgi:hypothetical protein
VVVRMNKINLTKTPCWGVSGGTIPPYWLTPDIKR